MPFNNESSTSNLLYSLVGWADAAVVQSIGTRGCTIRRLLFIIDDLITSSSSRCQQIARRSPRLPRAQCPLLIRGRPSRRNRSIPLPARLINTCIVITINEEMFTQRTFFIADRSAEARRTASKN